MSLTSFLISHRLFDKEGDSSTVDLTQVYDHLSYAEFQLGNVKRAAHYTRLMLQNGGHSLAGPPSSLLVVWS